eukprot:TRINITY_DN80685_c0_g1_i1.p1 TRINITY_DN80685_c0_g1~~TRINITY_DN80685_c0_g1_i1.p1  ORF type:complete len:1223 (+),score=190.12 TRINITY_DN80685_c0_g1_i1:36-3671(+)
MSSLSSLHSYVENRYEFSLASLGPHEEFSSGDAWVGRPNRPTKDRVIETPSRSCSSAADMLAEAHGVLPGGTSSAPRTKAPTMPMSLSRSVLPKASNDDEDSLMRRATSARTNSSSGMGSAASWSPRSSDDLATSPGSRLIRFSHEGGCVYPPRLNQLHGGRPNRIKTTKYTLLTWLPVSLYGQFKRIANVYFLIISVLVLFDISPKDPRSKVGPFVLVLLWAAIKDLWEDLRRRRDDDHENNLTAYCYDPESESLKLKAWKDIRCGDLLAVLSGEAFPADLVLLRTPGGAEALMSTVMLDGESNLKERVPHAALERLFGIETTSTSSLDPEQTIEDSGLREARKEAERLIATFGKGGLGIQLGSPDSTLSHVRGRLKASSSSAGQWSEIIEANFLPRGCILSKTPFVLGIVVYTGDDTKTRMKSANGFIMKFSDMQVYLNWSVWGLLTALLVFCAYAATMSTTVAKTEQDWLVSFVRYLIVLYHVVPMSLYIVYEVLKLVLGFQVNADEQMVDPVTKQSALARTTDLMEEIGQIDFIFSDKTGTLTVNDMVFSRCHVAGLDLGCFQKGDGLQRAKAVMEHPPEDHQRLRVHWFFQCLAMCHSVKVVQDQKGTKTYVGHSPDEVALVQAARSFGVCLENRFRVRGSQELRLSFEDGSSHLVSVLHVLEFSFERKRMSVIVKIGNSIHCICKGADNVMNELIPLPLSQSCEDDILRYSRQGLRTLVVASRELSKECYENWAKRLISIKKSAFQMQDQLTRDLYAEMERDLTFVGVTAVEDRLRDGVVEAISTLKQAGIRIWMLTGDKLETAVDIARSCSLFQEDTQIACLSNASSEKQAAEKLASAIAEADNNKDVGVVLDGATLQYLLMSPDSQSSLVDLGLRSRSCVCCRLSPMQKQQLVSLVRKTSPTTTTLAIGDGANDVAMLQGAHIGIGIRGNEGAQAVQASDIAISEFRFLVPLLLCHGRRAYRRVALFLCYYFYKNLALIMGDIVWMHQEPRFSGQIAFPEYLSIGFNAMFTSWHVLFALGFDFDVPDDVANSHPELYAAGPSRALFNRSVFVKWILYALWHGVVAWCVPSYWFGGNDYDAEESDLYWVSSCASFIIVVNIVMLRLFLTSVSPLKLTTWLPSLISVTFVFPVLWLLGYTPLGEEFQPNLLGVPEQLLTNSKALCVLFAVPFAALWPDCLEKLLESTFFPSELDKVLAAQSAVAA